MPFFYVNQRGFEGMLFCWGCGELGQDGHGGTAVVKSEDGLLDAFTPQKLGRVKLFACGSSHSVVVTGTVQCGLTLYLLTFKSSNSPKISRHSCAMGSSQKRKDFSKKNTSLLAVKQNISFLMGHPVYSAKTIIFQGQKVL